MLSFTCKIGTVACHAHNELNNMKLKLCLSYHEIIEAHSNCRISFANLYGSRGYMAYIIIISRSIIRTAYIIHIASHHSSVYRAFVGNRRTVPPIPLQNSCAILICVVECILFAGHPICVYRICTTHEAEDKMCLVRKFDTRTFCAEKLKCNA